MTMNAADELAKLHDLLNKGALTQEEYESAKARILAGAPCESGAPCGSAAINNFRLSESDKWIAGVCGGLADVTGLDSWVWRLLFALGAMFGGVTLLIYVLLWIFVPRESAN